MNHYEQIGFADIHFLCFQHRLNFDQIKKAVSELPEPFRTDILVHENLEYGYASHRALKRLAIYQANARLFGTVSFLRNILAHLGENFYPPATVPPHWVRDIGLPEFRRRKSPTDH